MTNQPTKLKKILQQIGLIVISLIIAFLSFSHQTNYKGIVGNVCDVTTVNPNGFCYEPLPQGGFPFIFYKDNPGSSVVGMLGPPEDDFYLAPFLGNVLFYFLLLNLVIFTYRRLKKKRNIPLS